PTPEDGTTERAPRQLKLLDKLLAPHRRRRFVSRAGAAECVRGVTALHVVAPIPRVAAPVATEAAVAPATGLGLIGLGSAVASISQELMENRKMSRLTLWLGTVVLLAIVGFAGSPPQSARTTCCVKRRC